MQDISWQVMSCIIMLAIAWSSRNKLLWTLEPNIFFVEPEDDFFLFKEERYTFTNESLRIRVHFHVPHTNANLWMMFFGNRLWSTLWRMASSMHDHTQCVCLTNFTWCPTSNPKGHVKFSKTKSRVNWHIHLILKCHLNFRLHNILEKLSLWIIKIQSWLSCVSMEGIVVGFF